MSDISNFVQRGTDTKLGLSKVSPVSPVSHGPCVQPINFCYGAALRFIFYFYFISVALRLSPSPKCQLPSHWRDSKRTAGQKQNPDWVSQKLTCTEHMSNSWSNDSRTLTRTLRALAPIRVLDRNQGNKTCINSARGFQTRNVQTETNRGKLTADNFFESSKARKSLRDSSGLCKTNLAWIPESL